MPGVRGVRSKSPLLLLFCLILISQTKQLEIAAHTAHTAHRSVLCSGYCRTLNGRRKDLKVSGDFV